MIDDRRRPLRIVPHAAWDAARAQLVAAAEPRTIALLGEPGTGKSLLMRAIAADFGGRGRVVIQVAQGDLPFLLSDGAVLLIDEAARMPPAKLADLLGQQRGVVVMADTPGFLDDVRAAGPLPGLVRLRKLTVQEVGFFAEDWLQQEPNGISLTKAAIAQLAKQSEGVPRLIVQLLTASLSLPEPADGGRIEPETIERMADLRLGGLAVEPALAFGPVRPKRGRLIAPMLAAGVVLAIAGVPARLASPPKPGLPPLVAAVVPPVPLAGSPMPPLAAAVAPATVANFALAPTLPPPAPLAEPGAEPSFAAEASAPVPLARSSAPAAGLATAVPAAAPASPVETSAAVAPAPSALPPAGPIEAAPAPEPAGPVVADRADLAAPPRAQRPEPPAVVPAPLRPDEGGPGLILVARNGDTLRSLYKRVYRGVRAPAFAAIEAANPLPLRAGALVVFPPPAGGWPKR